MYGVLADQQNVGLSSAGHIRHSEDRLHTPEGRVADLFGIYLFDPAYAKRIMPNATRLVRKLMQENATLTFYSIPFASLLAAILANMAGADGEEEDQRAALALGRGALTAWPTKSEGQVAREGGQGPSQAPRRNYFATLMETEEGRELQAVSTKKRKIRTPERRTDGYRKSEIEPIQANAKGSRRGYENHVREI